MDLNHHNNNISSTITAGDMTMQSAFLKKTLGVATILGAGFIAQHSLAQSANCSYSISNEWNTGATGAITITNTSTTAINGWTVGWQYTTNRITSSWNVNLSGSNPYSASNISWNGAIPPGQSVQFGFQIDKRGGSAERPTITGNICGGATSSTPSSSPVSSAPVSSVRSSVVSSSVVSSSVVSSSVVSSSVASSAVSGQQCNWYGTLYPLCVSTQSGWGYENNKSCISRSTCTSQPAPYGVVGGNSSAAPSSSSVPSSVAPSSSSAPSSVAPSSSSVPSSVAPSSVPASSSAPSSVAVSSSSVSSSSSVNGSGLKALADFPIGVAVAAGSGAADIFTNTARQNVVREEFSQIVAENIMKMSYMYSGSSFSFTNADRLASWAASNGKSLHGHALVWHPSYQLPSWATDTNTNFRSDYARHIDTVAAHFAGKVKSWDVVNEALFDSADDDGRGSANGYRQSVFYRQYGSPEYIDEAFRRARAADPTAELYYNDFNTEENGAKTTALVNLVQRLITNGAPIDGVGFQMHVMNDYPSIANIRASLQKIVNLSPTLKIKISELDVRLNNPYDGNSNNDYKNRSDCATSCAGLDTQKARYKEIIQAYLDIVPPARRGGVVVWGIADPDSWFYTNQNLPDWPLLFNDSLQKKPAYQGVAEALATVPRSSSSAISSSLASSSAVSSSSAVVTSSSRSSSSLAVVSSSAPSSIAVVSSSSRSSSSVAITSSSRSSSNSSIVRLDNPFAEARWYIDPIWSGKAQAETGGSKVANYNTAVWMDRIGAIEPTDGSYGLRDHLDAALAQNANVIQVVVYDLPNRDCKALASNGELKQGVEGSTRYRTEYVDKIVSIFSDSKYASLRIIAIIEPDSLPNLVTNLNDPDCQAATDTTYGYIANTRYTLSKLYPLANVYSYVDIGHSGWLGWDDNFGKAVTLIGDAIKGATGGVNSIAGFVSNTAGYTPLYEPFLDSLANSAFPGSGGGTQTRQAAFFEWNPYFSEVAFVQAWRTRMIAAGFPSTIGMLVDTSRNGWGGVNRPTAQSTSTVLDTFVNQSRIDKRTHRGNWCNQKGGIGERPQAAPVAGIDAYVWVKPPGESDGAASQELSYDPQDPAKGFDRMCDPTYSYSAGNLTVETGAMANAPVAGRWFKDGFLLLLNNAYPALQ